MKKFEKTNLNKIVRGAKRATYDKQKIYDILDAGFIAHVSYIYDGKAISLPMAYGRYDDNIILHGSRKNRMLLSLLKSKEASINVMHLDALILARSAFHHSVNYRSASLFGTVSEIVEETNKTEALKCVTDQMIPNRWETLRPISEKDLKSTLVIQFKIESASAKIRDVGVVDEKADLDYPVWAGVVPIKQIANDPISDELLPSNIEVPKHVLDYYNKNKS